jgi:hypothetical protein
VMPSYIRGKRHLPNNICRFMQVGSEWRMRTCFYRPFGKCILTRQCRDSDLPWTRDIMMAAAVHRSSATYASVPEFEEDRNYINIKGTPSLFANCIGLIMIRPAITRQVQQKNYDAFNPKTFQCFRFENE